MSKFYTNNYSDINLYRKKSSKSEVMTQMIYGDNFSAIKKSNKWWKIKIKEDGYIGFVKKKNFIKSVKPTHKVSKLSAKIYKKPNFKYKFHYLAYFKHTFIFKYWIVFGLLLIWLTLKKH